MKHKRLGVSLLMTLLLLCSMFLGVLSASAAMTLVTYSLEVTPASHSIDIGGTATYQAILRSSTGAESDVTASCTWTIADSGIGTLGSAGNFVGTASGTTTVTAVYPKPQLSANASLVVKSKGPILIILPDTNTINIGDTAPYRAYLRFFDGNPDQDVTDECTWGINDPIASISATKGEYIGLTEGTTTVTAHLVRKSTTLTAYRPGLDLTAEARLKVVQKQRQVGLSLEVTPPTATIWVGDSQQYKATLHYSDGTPDEDVTNASTWSLSNSIATSSTNGLYQGTTPGTATVTAKYTPPSYSELSDDATLIVKKKRDRGDNPPPETENLPLGKIIDRQPGYITLCDPQDLGTPAEEFTMTYDSARMDSNPDRHPKVFYWNTTYKKWIALASYPISSGKIKAINDGHYSGWFVVMGCIQPTFIDVYGNWAEKWVNRMNGLGLLEGYPDPTGGLQRPAGLDRIIIRSELTASVACILGLAPGDTKLYPTISFMSSSQNDAILNAHYSDADEIMDWARPYVAAMTQADLVGGIGGSFAPNNQLTRIEAAVIISNALRDVPGFGTPANLTAYTDYSEIPSWAIGKVAQGTISGYPDGSLRPNQPITRAETCALLITLLRGLGW